MPHPRRFRFAAQLSKAPEGTGRSWAEQAKKAEDKDKKAGKSDGTTESRYLMVTVAFDPKLVPEPARPKEELVFPDDPFQKAPDDPQRIADEKAAKEKADREKSARDKQLADAEKKGRAGLLMGGVTCIAAAAGAMTYLSQRRRSGLARTSIRQT